MNTRARIVPVVVIGLALGCALECARGCVSATSDPGDPLVGFYDATEHVAIMNAAGPMTIDDARPVSILHGANADLVLSDGLCIFSADATGSTTMTLHPNSSCVRDNGGSHVTLHVQSGMGTLAGRAVTVRIHGTFEFSIAPDAGMLPDGVRTGTFDLTITGTRL